MVIDHLKILLETYYTTYIKSCQKSDSNRKAKVILIVVGKHKIGKKVILQKSDSNRKAYKYNR